MIVNNALLFESHLLERKDSHNILENVGSENKYAFPRAFLQITIPKSPYPVSPLTERHAYYRQVCCSSTADLLFPKNTNPKSSKSQPRLEILSQHPSISRHFVPIRTQTWKVHTRLRQCPPDTDLPYDLQWIAPKLIVSAGKHCSIPQRHTHRTYLRMAAPTFSIILSSLFQNRTTTTHITGSKT